MRKTSEGVVYLYKRNKPGELTHSMALWKLGIHNSTPFDTVDVINKSWSKLTDVMRHIHIQNQRNGFAYDLKGRKLNLHISIAHCQA